MLKVLSGVNLRLAKGEKIGIIGESACGKTSTMKAVMRLLADNATITGGKINYMGQNILTLPRGKLFALRRRSMSMIFQDPSSALNPVFTIRQQLYDIVKYCSATHLSRKEIHEGAISYLKQAALPEPERILDSYPFQLSGGMKQRVNIAMSLVSAREILIADEPGTSLDVTIEDQIMRLLKKIVEDKGISVILIAHALGTVKHFVDRVYVMYAGTVAEEGPTDVVFNNAKHPYTRMLLEAVPKLTGGGVPEGILGQVPSYMNPPKGCRFVTRCPFAMSICNDQPPPMYEVENRHRVACYLYNKQA
jgi:peptide/nickel transport system ATP-binding protein